MLYTVDIRGVYEQVLMHNYRRCISVVLLECEGTDGPKLSVRK